MRAARQAARLTQEEAAHASGIDYKRFQRIEAGQANVTLKTLHRVATALGVAVGRLVTGR